MGRTTSVSKLLSGKVSKLPVTANASTTAKVPSSKQLPDNFQTLGTHCLRYISPAAKQVIDSLSENASLQVAAFDLDDTLVKTKSGLKFCKTYNDWKWFNDSVTDKLNNWLAADNGDTKFTKFIVVFTNQGMVTNNYEGPPSKSMLKLMDRLADIIANMNSGIPILVYASTKQAAVDAKKKLGSTKLQHESFRKPGPGMFEQLVKDLSPGVVSKQDSFFVGDAAGRKADFSDSDKVFASNCGLPFLCPEDFFV